MNHLVNSFDFSIWCRLYFSSFIRYFLDPWRRNLLDPWRRNFLDPSRRNLLDPWLRHFLDHLRRNLLNPWRRNFLDPLRRNLLDPLRWYLLDLWKRNFLDPCFEPSSPENAYAIVSFFIIISHFCARYCRIQFIIFCYISNVNTTLKILKIDCAFLFFLTLAGNFLKTQERSEATTAYE